MNKSNQRCSNKFNFILLQITRLVLDWQKYGPCNENEKYQMEKNRNCTGMRIVQLQGSEYNAQKEDFSNEMSICQGELN